MIVRIIPSTPPRGFTLIELMLAVGVLALVLAMLASSFSTVAHSKVHGETRMAIDHEGRAVLWQLSNELRDAVQTQPVRSNVMLFGAAHLGASGAADTVTVSTLAAGHRRALASFGPENIVTYNLVRNPNLRGCYLLERSQQSGLIGAGQISAPSSVVLAEDVLSLHLRYFDGKTWVESWDSSSMAPPVQLPFAVEIDLRMAAPNGHVMDFTTMVTTPMSIQQW